MNSKFLDWYTQALGATFGIIACIFAYLNGFISVYGNIERNFDSLGFHGVVSSYLLFPLCILTLSLAIIKCFYDTESVRLNYLNTSILITTVIIGFMGARVYFLIPTVLMLMNLFDVYEKKENLFDKNKTTEVMYESTLENEKELIFYEYDKEYTDNVQLPITKREIAKELLGKSADRQFIIDITGLSEAEIENLEKENL